MADLCTTDCELKDRVQDMHPKVIEIHDYITKERAAKEALDKAEETRRKNTDMYIKIITVGVLLVGGLYSFIHLIG